MSFEPITTQEQFDAAIGARIQRERETLGKKYADYDDLKTKVADYEKQIGELTTSMKENAGKYAGFDKQLAALEDKVKGYETSSVKMRIAHETGLPYELAGRLSGDTEEAIRQDAQSLSKLIGGAHIPPPLRSTEPAGVNKENAALKSFVAQLTSKGE